MTTKEFVALEKDLLRELPGLAIKGSLMFIPPVGSLLRGISFKRSSDKDRFYVSAFVIPLCVPTNHLYFNFGHRMRHGGADGWNRGMPDLLWELSAALKSQAMPPLSPVNSLLEFAEFAGQFNPKSLPTLRAIAYSLARAGEKRRAIDVLDRLAALCDPAVEWQRTLAQEGQGLKEKLLGDPEEARRQLEAWESETVHNLGLADVWESGERGSRSR
jgi:hypothetical protein